MEKVWPSAGKYYQTERTLDEAYYPALDANVLAARNDQQVVTRECKKTANRSAVTGKKRPVLVVQQLWIWSCSNIVISALNPLGMADSAYPNLPAGEYFRNLNGRAFGDADARIDPVPTLAADHISMNLAHIALILADRIDQFGSIQGAEGYQSPLDIFEVGVVQILSDMHEYMQQSELSVKDSETELVLMNRIADIKDELAMIDEILLQQDKVLDDVRAHIASVGAEKWRMENGSPKLDATKMRELQDSMEIPEQLTSARLQLQVYRNRIDKIERDAERVDKTMQDRLNVKRTYAQMSDAKTSLLVAVAVIGFTVITILFAPLAFMTALFALNIDILSNHKKRTGDDAEYTSGYIVWTFGMLQSDP